METLFKLLVHTDSPFALIAIALLTAVPLTIGALRSVFKFHNEFIRHLRLKNLETALNAIDRDSSEYRLLDECRAQEALFLNTGVRLSKLERTIVESWVTEAPVSFALIRKASPQIGWKDGNLSVNVAWYEKGFMWYVIVAFAFMWLFGTVSLLLVFEQAIFQGNLRLLLLPAFPFLFAFLLFRQLEPYVSARRLKHLLYQFRAQDKCHLLERSQDCSYNSELSMSMTMDRIDPSGSTSIDVN